MKTRLPVRKTVLMISALMLLLAGPQCCMADSITLISSGGGVYDYGLTLGANEGVTFDFGQTITLSGLSGVTGASVTGNIVPLFTVSSVTSTSVVFAQTAFPGGFTIAKAPFPSTTGDLIVDSSVLTTGTVDFSIQTANEGTATGTTQGPVAAVPEPSSLLLLGTGLLGLGMILRKTRLA